MANYCSNCLKKIPEGYNLCSECSQKISTEKMCFRCGKDVSRLDLLASRDDNNNYICSQCSWELIKEDRPAREKLREEEKARKEQLKKEEKARIEQLKIEKIEERYNEMRNGKAFIDIARASEYSNVLMNMKITVYNDKNSDKTVYHLISGESMIIDLSGRGRYKLVASILTLPKSKALFIDIDDGETVFIVITTKSSWGPLGASARILLNEEMISCRISKREIVNGDNIKVMEVNPILNDRHGQKAGTFEKNLPTEGRNPYESPKERIERIKREKE